jgi:hypothetical protein
MEEEQIHRTINRLRLYHTALIILGIAMSIIIVIAAEPITGIVLLVVLWSMIGLLMAYLTTKIKNLDIAKNRTAPMANDSSSAYAIPIYNVQPVANGAQQQPYFYSANPYQNTNNIYPTTVSATPYNEEKPLKQ